MSETSRLNGVDSWTCVWREHHRRREGARGLSLGAGRGRPMAKHSVYREKTNSA